MDEQLKRKLITLGAHLEAKNWISEDPLAEMFNVNDPQPENRFLEKAKAFLTLISDALRSRVCLPNGAGPKPEAKIAKDLLIICKDVTTSTANIDLDASLLVDVVTEMGLSELCRGYN